MIVNFTNGMENATASTHLYQWDVGQILKITGLGSVGTPKIHFSVKGDETALVVQSETVEGGISCSIPDKVLQTGKNIRVYVYVETGIAKATVKTIIIPVIARVKPNDYIETTADGVTEVQTFLESIGDEVDEISNKLTAGLPIVNGGTGATSASQARANLDAQQNLGFTPVRQGIPGTNYNKTVYFGYFQGNMLFWHNESNENRLVLTVPDGGALDPMDGGTGQTEPYKNITLGVWNVGTSGSDSHECRVYNYPGRVEFRGKRVLGGSQTANTEFKLWELTSPNLSLKPGSLFVFNSASVAKNIHAYIKTDGIIYGICDSSLSAGSTIHVFGSWFI